MPGLCPGGGMFNFRVDGCIKLREIEQETKHLFTPLSLKVMFSFLVSASLTHIFVNR